MTREEAAELILRRGPIWAICTAQHCNGGWVYSHHSNPIPCKQCKGNGQLVDRPYREACVILGMDVLKRATKARWNL